MSNTKNTKNTHTPKSDGVKTPSQVGGNNDPQLSEKLKKIRGRKWFITIFDFNTKIQNFIESAKYWIWSKEICPETKRDHWHAFIEFENARTKYSLAKILGKGQIDKARGKLNECINYVKKDGDFKTNIKMPKPLKLIDKLYPWQQSIIDIINKEADDRTVNWYYSEEGSKGKTQLIKLLAVKYKALVIGGRVQDIANGLKNYHEANGEYPELVCMNLARDVKNLSYKGLEMIKDGLVINTKYECSQHIFNSPHLFVFANMRPKEEKLSKDRWNIVNLDEPKLSKLN